MLKNLVIYQHNRNWVFDDDRFDLVKEPFVRGATDAISAAIMMKNSKIKRSPYLLYFSENANDFPKGSRAYTLTWLREENSPYALDDGSWEWGRKEQLVSL
jgi:hypothetical protein